MFTQRFTSTLMLSHDSLMPFTFHNRSNHPVGQTGTNLCFQCQQFNQSCPPDVWLQEQKTCSRKVTLYRSIIWQRTTNKHVHTGIIEHFKDMMFFLMNIFHPGTGTVSLNSSSARRVGPTALNTGITVHKEPADFNRAAPQS